MDDKDILSSLKMGQHLYKIEENTSSFSSILRFPSAVNEITEKIENSHRQKEISEFDSFWIRGRYGSGKTESLLAIKNNLTKDNKSLATIYINAKKNVGLDNKNDFGKYVFKNFVINTDNKFNTNVNTIIDIVNSKSKIANTIQKSSVKNGLKLAEKVLDKNFTKIADQVPLLGFILNPLISLTRKKIQYSFNTISAKVKKYLSEIDEEFTKNPDLMNLIAYWIRYSIFLDNDTKQDLDDALNNKNIDLLQVVLCTLQLIGFQSIVFFIDEADKIYDNTMSLQNLENIWDDPKICSCSSKVNTFFIFACTYEDEKFLDSKQVKGFARRFVEKSTRYSLKLPNVTKEYNPDDDLNFTLRVVKDLITNIYRLKDDDINLKSLDKELRPELSVIAEIEELSWDKLWNRVYKIVEKSRQSK